ncbi:uncharacterized protein LOC122723994 [Manihot esculenta]|uniref:uncharacterized protein LOC122723994 n=1 Tax=Manihot esculenta TaxID=3983 RepID=UPI001CC5D808|nr:uncharacterized protein LOC122723994 [Manihot esculenta]
MASPQFSFVYLFQNFLIFRSPQIKEKRKRSSRPAARWRQVGSSRIHFSRVQPLLGTSLVQSRCSSSSVVSSLLLLGKSSRFQFARCSSSIAPPQVGSSRIHFSRDQPLLGTSLIQSRCSSSSVVSSLLLLGKSSRFQFARCSSSIAPPQENYLKLKEQHSSQNVGSDHVEGDGGTINEDQLFITAAGGWQGSRVYGLGSAASSAFSQTGTVGKTTDVPSSQSPEWKKEIEAKFEEKYNSLQKIVEDQNQIIAQMRDELQAMRMGQQSSSLML